MVISNEESARLNIVRFNIVKDAIEKEKEPKIGNLPSIKGLALTKFQEINDFCKERDVDFFVEMPAKNTYIEYIVELVYRGCILKRKMQSPKTFLGKVIRLLQTSRQGVLENEFNILYDELSNVSLESLYATAYAEYYSSILDNGTADDIDFNRDTMITRKLGMEEEYNKALEYMGELSEEVLCKIDVYEKE